MGWDIATLQPRFGILWFCGFIGSR